MMKKHWVASLIVCGFVVHLVPTLASPTTRSTEATIEFVDLLPPKVLDPENPDDVLDVTPNLEGDVNTASGELTLDFAPNLNFGTNDINESEKGRYKALPIGKMKGPFVQVTDRRELPGAWTVSVKAASFMLPNKIESLKGAMLEFEGGTIRSKSLQEQDIENKVIEGPELAHEEDGMTSVITGKDAVPLLRAATGQATSSWIAHWIEADSGVYLKVPTDVITRGVHTADLIWTLSADIVPSQSN